MAEEYITKKVPKKLNPLIRRLKAKMSLGGKKVTEGDVIALGLAKLEQDMEKHRRKKLIEMAGIIKGGEQSDAKDIDRLLYGD